MCADFLMVDLTIGILVSPYLIIHPSLYENFSLLVHSEAQLLGIDYLNSFRVNSIRSPLFCLPTLTSLSSPSTLTNACIPLIACCTPLIPYSFVFALQSRIDYKSSLL